MLENTILFLLAALSSYLIGCINSSIIVTRLFKTKSDIRDVGSGNAGFTNVLRTMGKKMAIFTFIGDFIKGVLAVWLATSIFSFTGAGAQNIKYSAYIASFFCILGHIYPCFFKFRGGKGILTAWATSLLVDWRVFLIIISVFLITLVFSKIVSLSSIIAAFSYPIATISMLTFDLKSLNLKSGALVLPMFVSVLMAILVIYKHKSNIARLRNGTEKKIIKNKN